MIYRKVMVTPLLALLIFQFFVLGCGTIITNFPGFEEEVRNHPKEVEPKCIPRFYSGMFFDIYVVKYGAGDVSQGVLLLDIPLSIAADTLVSPYTIYKQIRHGSICREDKISEIPQQSADKPKIDE